MTDLNKAVTRKVQVVSVPHGVKPQIIVTLYPGGTIGFREAGRRQASEVYFDAGRLYLRGVENKVAYERLVKGKKRANERKLRKLLK